MLCTSTMSWEVSTSALCTRTHHDTHVHTLILCINPDHRKVLVSILYHMTQIGQHTLLPYIVLALYSLSWAIDRLCVWQGRDTMLLWCMSVLCLLTHMETNAYTHYTVINLLIYFSYILVPGSVAKVLGWNLIDDAWFSVPTHWPSMQYGPTIYTYFLVTRKIHD